MTEVVKDFNAMKVLLWIVPGAFIALFRSFAMRGSFPIISKDDIATLSLGSIVYYFIVILLTTGLNIDTQVAKPSFTPWMWFFVLIIIPAFVGLGLGILEASDAIGRVFRCIGIRLPSPGPTAWETMFGELAPQAVLLVTLKDGTLVSGRWVGGKGGSASSTDADTLDLYLGEIGTIDDQGQYVPNIPRRGAYIVASEIRFIEVISVR
jgi:Family of unknown function (DUF6338)